MLRKVLFLASTLLILSACKPSAPEPQAEASPEPADTAVQTAQVEEFSEESAAPSRYDIYAPVTLTTNLDHLSDNQKQMIPLLIEASKIMDGLFWQQAYGDKESLLAGIVDPKQRQFAEINYGPWDRLDGDASFVEQYGPKPLGARFYPEDMTRDEFEAWDQEGKEGLYSIVRRNEEGGLELAAYSDVFAEQLSEAADLLRQAAELADDPEFANYLRLRADAFMNDEYQPSDMAWMDMKNNRSIWLSAPSRPTRTNCLATAQLLKAMF